MEILKLISFMLVVGIGVIASMFILIFLAGKLGYYYVDTKYGWDEFIKYARAQKRSETVVSQKDDIKIKIGV